ncbi:glycosyltransferase family 2 protein [Methanoplanus endosymbiosus]|uniref:Glycosyltransferase n=1 Tax=Methanoplanus endosymbiosus TaxID=33865 RepID=A0A9E7PNN7_9EURY|nr:glycosyltransferase [Methanoplanus endosymbiosus]UUX92246.1 glycosyltransferase [Methanoplanus endosymbiosus]
MKPLVTVYITNYNYGHYIRQAILSVLNQTFQDFELLIIDDGSTDHSRQIIEEYRDHPKIQIIYQMNNGLNYSNNIAIRAANGRYIMRLDADDFLDPMALDKMSKILEKHDEFGLVFPDYYYVNSEGIIIGEERRHNFNKDVSLFDLPAHGACTMIRLSHLNELGGYNDSFTCQDGYELWIRFIKKYGVTNINEPLFYYRQHDNNLTNNEKKILETRRKINSSLIDTSDYLDITTIAIIPIRKKTIGDIIWPLYVKANGKTILEEMVEIASNSNKIHYIVVSTEDKEIQEYVLNISDKFKKLHFISRPPEYARINVSLNQTIQDIIIQCNNFIKSNGIIMQLSIDYPFMSTHYLEDAINTMLIFQADSLLSVRPDSSIYYQHTGSGLIPILNQEKFTRYERDALYKGVGGLVLSTMENFHKNNRMVSGKVGHVIADQLTAFGVFSEFDLAIFELVDKHLINANEFGG